MPVAPFVTDRFRVCRYTLTGGQPPVPVVTPIACNYVGWRNLGSAEVAISTFPYTAVSFDTLSGFAQNLIVVPPSGPKELRPRFDDNMELCRLQLVDSSPEASTIVVVQFVF